MTTSRAALVRLLDAHPWSTPNTLMDAQRLYASLAPLRDTARTLHGDDRICRLIPLRFDLFLAHWPQPPELHNLDRFEEDARLLITHDVPRLRELLLWAPAQLPQQRAPRLGVATLNTV